MNIEKISSNLSGHWKFRRFRLIRLLSLLRWFSINLKDIIWNLFHWFCYYFLNILSRNKKSVNKHFLCSRPCPIYTFGLKCESLCSCKNGAYCNGIGRRQSTNTTRPDKHGSVDRVHWKKWRYILPHNCHDIPFPSSQLDTFPHSHDIPFPPSQLDIFLTAMIFPSPLHSLIFFPNRLDKQGEKELYTSLRKYLFIDPLV